MRKWGICLSVIFSLFFTSKAGAFSLVDDWSNLSNPNGAWSYNEGNNPLPFNIEGWPAGEFGLVQTAWAKSNVGGTYLPGWFKSVNDANPLFYDWLSGDVIVHTTPGYVINPDIANVIWTSPASNLFDINGGLWSGRDIGRSNDWNLYLDDDLVANGSLFTGDVFSRSNPNSFNFSNISILKDSILKLEVISTEPNGDFVGVNFNINSSPQSTIPEPSSILLFASGFIGFLIKRCYS